MHWGNPNALFLLILIPLGFILTAFSRRLRKKKFSVFAEKRFFNFYYQQFSAFRFELKNIFLIIALMFIIIAIARPQWDREMQIVRKEGVDIVLLLDVSLSMSVNDVAPNRLERAKDQISLFIDQLKGDRIAIVGFAGRSFVQCPLTDDYEAARHFLSFMDTDSAQMQGSDIGNALETAINLFHKKDKHKIILLISDGEDLEKTAVDVAKEIKKKGAVIYSLGIGNPEGAPLQITTESGDVRYAKDNEGNIIYSKLDAQTLTAIAQETGGRFFPITPQQSEILEIANEIKTMEKKKFDSRQYIRYKDQYMYFVWAAFGFLILETVIIVKRKTKFNRSV